MLVRVDHIDLKVPDLESAVGFFTTLGFVVERRAAERGSVELRLPGENQVMFELRQDAKVDGTKIDHVAFATDDADGSIELIKTAGGRFTREHHPTDSGRTVSNFIDLHGGKWQLAE